jgi:hypothetical protein
LLYLLSFLYHLSFSAWGGLSKSPRTPSFQDSIAKLFFFASRFTAITYNFLKIVFPPFLGKILGLLSALPNPRAALKEYHLCHHSYRAALKEYWSSYHSPRAEKNTESAIFLRRNHTILVAFSPRRPRKEYRFTVHSPAPPKPYWPSHLSPRRPNIRVKNTG